MMRTGRAPGEAGRTLTEIRKTGCSLDSARINMLSTVEVLHRAAKHAGLAEVPGNLGGSPCRRSAGGRRAGSSSSSRSSGLTRKEEAA